MRKVLAEANLGKEVTVSPEQALREDTAVASSVPKLTEEEGRKAVQLRWKQETIELQQHCVTCFYTLSRDLAKENDQARK